MKGMLTENSQKSSGAHSALLTKRIGGTHIIADLYGCKPLRLNSKRFLQGLLVRTARRFGATVIGSNFHKFEPHGVTGTVLLAESHMSIHTWPERSFATLDVFTCGDMLPLEMAHVIKNALQANFMCNQTFERGDADMLIKADNWSPTDAS